MTKEEVQKLTPLEAYNQAVKDCAANAEIHCSGNPETMCWNNVSPKDIRFFDVDKDSILKNLIE